MNKEQFLSKLKESALTEQDKIDIFNWYIHNEAPERIAEFEQLPGREFKLSEQTVLTVHSPQGKQILEYSIIKIKEELGLTPKTTLNLITFLMGFRN